MKRFLLLSFVLSIFMLGYAQSGSKISKELREFSVKREHQNPVDDVSGFENYVNPTVTTTPVAKGEKIIGTTFYDLQSNAATGNRVCLFDDGTVGAVWTRGMDSPPDCPDRGTGYNYFDGTSWGPIPTARVEAVRTGWPSIAAWGDNGEIIVAHTGAVAGLAFNKRDDKGTGAWSQFNLVGPDLDNVLVWPRMITSGPNNDIIHVITCGGNAIAYQGQTPAMLYSRSADGGATWDPLHEVLPGLGPDYYVGINADEYTWAAPHGDVIAFTVADSWHDWFVMKSEDGGTNWEKIMVWENPYPFFDFNVTLTTDTLWCPDGSADIALDNTGMVHVVCGIGRVAHTAVGTSYSYWPVTHGIAYWNETMPPFTDPNENQHDALDAEDVLIEDYNLIGWMYDVNNNGELDIPSADDVMAYRSLGLCTMPNITISPCNQIAVAWSGTSEGYYFTELTLFKHIWMRRSYDNGITWGDSLDIDTDLTHSFDECIYPVMAKGITGDGMDSVRLIYNVDYTPGLGLDNEHPYEENRMIYFNDSIFCLITGIDKLAADPESLKVSQNFPNPITSRSMVRVELSERANLSLEVTNLVGQVVYQINRGQVNAGAQMFEFDAADFKTGVYFYTVKAGESSVTQKMIVE